MAGKVANRASDGAERTRGASTSAWKRWLAEPRVRSWHDAMRMASSVTADERLRVLARYCNALGTTPTALADRARASAEGRRGVEDELQAFVVRMKDAGHSPGYIQNYVKSAKSWLRHNDVALVRKIVVGDTGATPTVEYERVPTREELREVLEAADRRTRVEIAFLALAGVRPEVLGTMGATNGLRLRDLPDLQVRGERVRFLRIPARITVPRELSKVRRRYLTFLPGEGCEYTIAYLRTRLSRGEVLGPDSPVVRPEQGYDVRGRASDSTARGSLFLGRQGVTRDIRNVFRAKGIMARPYVLRSYFVSALASAERDGKITQLDREFFEGRKGAISARYSVHKELTGDIVEEMRAEFAACEPFLTTRHSGEVASLDPVAAREVYGLISGLNPEDMRALSALVYTAHGETPETLLEKVRIIREARGAPPPE